MIAYSRTIPALILAGIFLFNTCAYSLPLENTPPADFSSPVFILTESGTNTVIFENGADEPRQAASLIKLTSILLFLEALESGTQSPDSLVTVSSKAAATPGSTALLDANSAYRFDDLLKCCIIASANDATVALAEHIAGSEEAFVNLMNQKAKALGLTNSQYRNCTGLSAKDQYSSARDISIVASELCSYPLFFEYSSLWLSSLTHPSGRVTDLTNTNRLVRFYSSCDGMKTGSSPEAGYCICATATNGEMRLISVILGAGTSQLRFNDAKSMLEYGLASYKRTVVIKSGEMTGYSLPVSNGASDQIGIAAGKGLSLLLKNGQEKQLSVTLSLPDSVNAPLPKGTVVGEIHVHLNGTVIAHLPACIADDVRLPGFLEGFLRIRNTWR